MYDLTDTKPIHIDELREFAVRDPYLLQPGDEVIFVHLPTLADPDLEHFPQGAYATRGTVVEVAMRSQRELHPTAPGYPKDYEKGLVILFREEGSETERYRYAADSGVIGYTSHSTGFNSTNFTVRLADLEERGLEFIDGTTADYAARLEVFNSQIVPSDLDYYYFED